MSAHAGRGFVPVLREIDRGMAAPLPARTRILRELEYDLEELTLRLTSEGLDSAEARRRALDALVPDRATLEALERLHASWYGRLTRHLTPGRLRLAERGALAGATALLVGSATRSLLRLDLMSRPSAFLVPVLVVGSALFAWIAAKAFQLWVKRDHARPDHGLRSILLLSAATLLTGVAGVFVDVYNLAATLEFAPQSAGVLAPAALVTEAVLLSVALLIALIGGLAWFVLSHWVAYVQGAWRDTLGFSPIPPNGRR